MVKKTLLVGALALAIFSCKKDNQEKAISEMIVEANGIKIEMIGVPSGSFMMGSPEDEKERSTISNGMEEKQHQVNLNGFYIAKYEVTQELYKAVMGSNPSLFTENPKNPVERISWIEANMFIDKLNTITGKQFRLPTEAEWEYACRAGSTTRFSWGDDITADNANYQASGLKQTTAVGSYAPNAWGLYDMHGNVIEWLSDYYDKDYYSKSPTDNPTGPAYGTKRSCRGGSWNNSGKNLRSAYRDVNEPEVKVQNIGLRLAMSK